RQVVEKRNVHEALISALESLVETHLRLGIATVWEVEGTDRKFHELRLLEDEHYSIVDRSLTLTSLLEQVSAYHRESKTSWTDFEDEEQILAKFGPDYHDDQVPWKRAAMALNAAIVSGVFSYANLELPSDCDFPNLSNHRDAPQF